jgi:ATP-dependent Lon protease
MPFFGFVHANLLLQQLKEQWYRRVKSRLEQQNSEIKLNREFKTLAKTLYHITQKEKEKNKV